VAIKLDESDSTKYIWIFRKWSGQAVVYPSPAIMKEGSEVHIVNKTDEKATVVFPKGFMKPAELTISPGRSRPATAKQASPYFEYDVTFSRRGVVPVFYAEGGSKPGVIIEH